MVLIFPSLGNVPRGAAATLAPLPPATPLHVIEGKSAYICYAVL